VPVPLAGNAGGEAGDGLGLPVEPHASVSMTAAAAVITGTARHPCRFIMPPGLE
jgi:hypothetical protein